MGIIRAKQSIIGGPIPDDIARDAEYIAALNAHTAAVDPHPVYLTQAEGDGRYRISTVPLIDADIPAGIARDSEITAALNVHTATTNPHAQYLSSNPSHVEFGLNQQNIIDFHVGTSLVDFDVRAMAYEGINQNGQGKFSLQLALLSILGKISLSGGAQLARFLMTSTYIDLPSIAVGNVYDIFITIPGATIGDMAFFVPCADLYNGLWTFNIQAAVTNNDVARIYFQNLYSTSVHVNGFSAKIIVIGF